MKKSKLFLVLLLLAFAAGASAQYNDNSEMPTSIAIQPPGMNISPSGVLSNPVTINGFDNFALGTDFGEPSIATNPRDPFNSICAFNINNYYYTLDGFNWTKVNVSFPGFSVLGDPVLTFDSTGNAYYTQLYQNGGTYGIAVAKSTNKGVSWNSVYNVASTTVGLSDKEWIAADQTAGPYSNNLYIGWRQFGSTGMRVVRSTDGAATWSTPQIFTGSQGAYVAVGPNGSIQGGSSYFACINGSSILVNRSTDGGVTYSAQNVAVTFVTGGVICAGRNTVKSCIRMNGFPRMSADNSYTSSRGNVYIVYARNPGTSDITDINFVRSTDYGNTWSAPLRVNDDATTTDQWDPAISVDSKTGKIFVSWFDSREDPVNNLMTKVYGAVSTNGGVSFLPNSAVSNAAFNPNNMAVNQPGGEKYIGDYFGIQAIGNTSYSVWEDGRNNNLGSYTGYYPDFAMTLNANTVSAASNDSTTLTVKIPAVNGPFSQRVRFSGLLDTLPSSGTISFSLKNGKDTISSYPDSVTMVIKVSSGVPTKAYYLNVIGKGTDGPPVHIRKVTVLVNSALLAIGTNRPGIAEFKVNGVSYNQPQQLIFPLGTNVTVQAVSPRILGVTQYVFTNWSDGGDTTHNISLNSSLNLTAFYKIQYRLSVSSAQGTTFGGNVYYDSGTSATFGVNSRIVVNGGTTYYFRGWNGNGNGSYTSPDSTGLDSVVTVNINNSIVQTARWTTTVGITSLGTEIPVVYNLSQNFPNPFNPSTSIDFALPKSGIVKLMIYDITGKEVAVLLNEFKSAGNYRVNFNGKDYGTLSSGVYYYRLESNDFTDIKKMILIK
ncbi:MAG: T9SS type A sorting domain-containing protein [Ignavibacteria bacterium]|nr:T9SS type A sorting domain-containing protein [Ignavibacteria bacterium]